MSINKKLIIGILVLLLLIMAVIIIKTVGGSSDQLATKSHPENNNTVSLVDMAKEKRAKDLEALQKEVMDDAAHENQSFANATEASSVNRSGSAANESNASPEIKKAEANSSAGQSKVNTPNATQTMTTPANASTQNTTAPATGNRSKTDHVNASKPGQNATNVVLPKEPSKAPPLLGSITVEVQASGKGVVMTITATNPIPSYKYATLSSPNRVMVDILGGQWNFAKEANISGQNLISKIRYGKHADSSRIVADLNTQSPVSVDVQKPSPKKLILTIKPH